MHWFCASTNMNIQSLDKPTTQEQQEAELKNAEVPTTRLQIQLLKQKREQTPQYRRHTFSFLQWNE